MNSLKDRFGRRIRQLRKKEGWTQQILADKSGMDYPYLGAIERGEKNPTLEFIEKIAKGLNIETYQLFSFDDIIDLQIDEELTIDEIWKECDKKKRKKLLAIINAIMYL